MGKFFSLNWGKPQPQAGPVEPSIPLAPEDVTRMNACAEAILRVLQNTVAEAGYTRASVERLSKDLTANGSAFRGDRRIRRIGLDLQPLSRRSGVPRHRPVSLRPPRSIRPRPSAANDDPRALPSEHAKQKELVSTGSEWIWVTPNQTNHRQGNMPANAAADLPNDTLAAGAGAGAGADAGFATAA
jgi:hypothetical protein